MSSLDSRVPPPAVVLVIAVLMWLIARAAPLLHVGVPAHKWLAAGVVSVGFVTGISGVITFLNAKTTVDPMKPRASSWSRGESTRFLAIRCTWAVSSCCWDGHSSYRTR